MVNIILGYLLIFSAFIIALIYLIRKLPKPGLAITVCFLMVFTGIFIIVQERATEIVIKEVGTIKMVVKQVRNDAEEIHNLRTYLDSMFTLSSEGEAIAEIGFKTDKISEKTYGYGITLGSALKIGNFQLTEDGGVMTFADMNVTAETSDGDVMSYAFKIDANSILIVKAESDGKGGTKNKKVECNGDFEILDPDNGVILTSSNGSKWLLKVKNSGELDITKF